MKTTDLQSKVADGEVMQILDSIVDAVFALKAQLWNSNMDSNSIGGIRIPPPKPYNVPMGIHHRTKAPKDEQLTGELKGDLAAILASSGAKRCFNMRISTPDSVAG